MGKIWVISDTHFNHSNILTFRDNNSRSLIREFSSVEEMNETMIERWNEVVRPGDKVYHLGDVFFGPKEWFKQNWSRLNGSKRLVVGNHDDIQFLTGGGFFKKVNMWRCFGEYNILMSHVPLHYTSLFRNKNMDKPMLNVHGHIHQHKSPEGPYKCVCVEQTDYRPVDLEELIELAKTI